MSDEKRPFLARWSQRKAQVRSGVVPTEPVPAPAVAVPLTAQPAAPAPAPHPVPASGPGPVAPEVTMDDVAALTHASDYSRFVAPGVASGVRNAAMKKLFSDPHFNVMDGLDIYIGDYSQPDPIPPEMLRQMVQSKFLGLFDDEEQDEQADAAGAAQAPPGLVAAASGAADNPVHDDHTDLRLQPDHAAGRPGPDESTGPGSI